MLKKLKSKSKKKILKYFNTFVFFIFMYTLPPSEKKLEKGLLNNF